MKVLITTLPFSGEIHENGFTELFGNPVRGWSAFHYFNKWGIETYFLLPKNVIVSNRIKEKYNNRFIESNHCSNELLDTFDYIIIASTRLLNFCNNVYLASKIAQSQAKIILALCYDDTEERTENCKLIISKTVAVGFVSPYYIADPNDSFSSCYKYRITSGVSRVPLDSIRKYHQNNNIAISFVGFVHTRRFCSLISDVARRLPSYQFKLSSLRYTDWDTKEQHYIRYDKNFESSVEKFLHMFASSDGKHPDNLSYTYTKNIEDEVKFLSSSSIGIDYCWNNSWKFDNSKVNRYLSYGLPVITTKPSLSYRHVNLFNDHGLVLPFNPKVESIENAIIKLTNDNYQNIETRMSIAEKAQNYFDWKNVAFEIYEALLGVVYQ